jgi:hypothetical protein
MRIDDLFLVKDQNLEEGPVWDKTRKVGATIGKGIGGVSQAVGAVAGVPSGIIRGMAKGYNRASDTIAGGPDENPQQSSGGNPQQPQGQSAGSSFAQGLQGGASSGGGAGGGAVAGKLRQQAKQLMSMADELEKGGAEPQGQQSAPPTQAPQAQQTTQEPPDASSSQPQSTAQASAADQSQDWPTIAGGGEAKINPDTGEKFASPADAHAYLDAREKETPALAAPANNVSTPSSTNGQINQTSTGLVHKADPNNPNNKQSTSAKSNADVTDVELKPKSTANPLSLPAPTAAPTANYGKQIPGYGQTTMSAPPGIPGATNKLPPASTDKAARRAQVEKERADRLAGKGFQAGAKYAAEGVEFYSKFFKKMI